MRDPGDPGVLGIESYVPPPQNTLPLIEPFVKGFDTRAGLETCAACRIFRDLSSGVSFVFGEVVELKQN